MSDENRPSNVDVDDDDDVGDLDDFLDGYRAQRIKELQKKAAAAMRPSAYTELASDDEYLRTSIASERVVVHFFHDEFQRCKIMDKHLQKLAYDEGERVKVFKINVNNAPFSVKKLKIQVLPCVVSVVNGKIVDKLIGFEPLGNRDDFTERALRYHLQRVGVLPLDGKKRDDDDDDNDDDGDAYGAR